MPGVKNTTKAQGRYAKAANSENAKATEEAMAKEGSFGRVDKALGNRQFTVTYYDGERSIQLLAIPRGVFSAGGKARVFISVGDIVILDGLQDINKKETIVEITGRFDKKQAQDLFKLGRLHKSIYSIQDEVDDLFDYSTKEKEEEEEVDIERI